MSQTSGRPGQAGTLPGFPAHSEALREPEIFADTHPGKVREANEDSVYPHAGAAHGPIRLDSVKLAARGYLVIVADGVGGGQAGARASERAVQYASDGYYDGQAPDVATNLRLAVESANHWLYDMIQRDPSLSQAATTLTAAIIQGDTLTVAHVGDSRAYLVRNGQITKITTDHTLAQEKLVAGRIRPEEVADDPDRSTLTRSLGIGPHVQVDLHQGKVVPGDVVVLCSDGLTDVVEDGEIAATVGREAPRKAVRKLIALANQRGGPDNVTVAIMEVPGKTAAPSAGWAAWQKTAAIALAALIGVVVLALAGYMVYEALKGPPSTAVGSATVGVTGSPTAGLAPTPTSLPGATGRPGETRSPTSTPLSFTATPFPAPTNTPKPGATATPTTKPTVKTSAPRFPAPVLIEPKVDELLHEAATFRWRYDGPALGDDYAFDLRIWSKAEDEQNLPRRGAIEPTNETEVTLKDLGGLDVIEQYQTSVYYWAVVVVKKGNPPTVVGAWSDKRQFSWSPPPEPTESPSPGPTQTPSPTATTAPDPCEWFVCSIPKCCASNPDPCCAAKCSWLICPSPRP